MTNKFIKGIQILDRERSRINLHSVMIMFGFLVVKYFSDFVNMQHITGAMDNSVKVSNPQDLRSILSS
jgi:hypothetical protein